MAYLNGVQKNQTVKKEYTVEVFLSTEFGDQEVFSLTVSAESVKEALRLVTESVTKR